MSEGEARKGSEGETREGSEGETREGSEMKDVYLFRLPLQ